MATGPGGRHGFESPVPIAAEATLPIYEFKCRACGEAFEAIRPLGDSGADLECPACGAASPEKQISVFAASTGGTGSAGSSRGSCGAGFS